MPDNPTQSSPPAYVVLHDAVGTHVKGDTIPPGTYSEEQMARLVELGAVEAVAPEQLALSERERVERARPDVGAADSRAAQRPADQSATAPVPTSSEEFKAQEDARAIEAAGGPPAPLGPNVHGIGPDTDGGRNPEYDPLTEVSDDQAAALRAAGYGTPEAIRSATDAQLEAVPGVGPAAIARLRAATQE